MFSSIEAAGHESVLISSDPRVGYRGIIAIHSRRLGPAVGGTRFLRYPSTEAALQDALRLAEGMSYKNALAGLPFGGGKGVILDLGSADRNAVLEAHARQIDLLGGNYITGEDVGTTVTDTETMRRVTPYVAGLTSGAGDPSPFTARGVVRAIEACAAHRFGSNSLEGRTVAIQGLGSVGFNLARQLSARGVRLLVHDIRSEVVQRAADELGAIPTDDIIAARADIFAPCALGGVLDRDSIERLDVQIIAGAANNQLTSTSDAEALERRGILYCPDFVANAGGVISGGIDILGWQLDQVNTRVDAIYDTVLMVLRTAEQQRVTTAEAAVTLAKQIIDNAPRPTTDARAA